MACQWCGASLPRPVVTPTEPLAPGPPPPLVFEPLPAGPPPPQGDRDQIAIGVALAAFVIVMVVAVLAFAPVSVTSGPSTSTPIPSPGGAINVTEVLVSSPDDACGLNGSTHSGFHATSVAGWTLTWYLPVSGAVPCQVATVSSDTGGFTAFSYYLPMNVTSPDTPLEVNLFVPVGANWTGALNLTFT
jgi:hypothetical protein